jgi:uncharacterized membrane protein YczE
VRFSTLAPGDRGPTAQPQSGPLPRRLAQLFVGVVLYGVGIGLIVRAALGLSPWDVFHAGVLRHTGGSFGAVVTVVGIAVLLLWVPLRQKPGLGTVANVVVIGASIDATLAHLDQPEPLLARATLLVLGIGLNGFAGALYLGAQLGPSARDGLMTGLARRTGLSLRLVRTGIELSVLAVGFALGGAVGVGTILYALTIGPLVHFFLPLFTVGESQTD